jgi:hypothetical protein
MNKENWSLLSFRERLGYRMIRFLSFLQQLVHTHILRTYVWRSADGTLTPLPKMRDRHLNNCIKMLNRQGDQPKTLELLHKERARRLAADMRRFDV